MFAYRSLSRRLLCMAAIVVPVACSVAQSGSPEPQGRVDVAWLEQRLQAQRPRLLWQEGLEDRVRERIAVDPVVRRYSEAIFEQADAVLQLPVLERKVTGRRLLDVSRAALKRTTFLAFAWRMSGDRAYLERLEECLVAVSRFSDWNPSHFLDVAEMALGVSLALDWAGEAMDSDVRALAEAALYEKALAVSMEADLQYVFRRPNNWNQVCNAGIVAAAIQLAETYPEEAAAAIERMRENLHLALETYAPDGAYVEGPMYWNYGTSFNAVLLDVLDTALGTTFDLEQAPGFMESADFVLQMKAPSGFYYNYYDCFLRSNYMGGLLWFAKETGNRLYAQPEHMMAEVNWSYGLDDVLDRLLVVELLWLLDIEPGPAKPLANNWVANGENPVGVLRSSFEDKDALYLAFKGGRADNAHGNMDGGAFVFELDGVRWAIDLGNQAYHELEEYYKRVGGSLWARAQDSARWGLLSKNNFGHSTVTVNEALHQVSGMVDVASFDAERGTATLDMGALYGDKVKSARRSFRTLGKRSLEIRDRVEVNEATERIRWQMTTQASLLETKEGLLLKRDGEELSLAILSPEGLRASVTSLELPLHPMDKTLPGLKRIDLVVPAHLAQDGVVEIVVRLSGNE
ncbi:heparinase II/III family protein [Pelagicoccus sp. SDUM812005]|uniref:heparinase II/III domain-containing protein n=1 Tax=Pelagicoccus sp. SDUM812005 TaxID=3041257 RepID=UPI00280E9736|nr:heparinase II/III family protein [Pelagicoccus sp. SDUM812005]MDQ8182608.1 heparinase II/III family protein [Pelagicoccus sp. SDUM812005]